MSGGYTASVPGKNRHLRKGVYSKVARAIRSGLLTRVSCEQCGRIDSVAHHDDYALPLSVRWLCFTCHFLFHHPTCKPSIKFGFRVSNIDTARELAEWAS
jgi:ribosomal protein S27AE